MATVPGENEDNYVIFMDRVQSLLDRWERYRIDHPEIPQGRIVKACMSELNDGFTERLKEE